MHMDTSVSPTGHQGAPPGQEPVSYGEHLFLETAAVAALIGVSRGCKQDVLQESLQEG